MTRLQGTEASIHPYNLQDPVGQSGPSPGDVRVTLACHCSGVSEHNTGGEGLRKCLEIHLPKEFTICVPWANRVLSPGLSFFVFDVGSLE